mmetsp:Transcript_114116/g.179654  ORF Transcript_114116/g.179654 Transcript_114116/m.179654 type:complete len:128 (-) Transcript_114116:101-484(-)
MVVARVAATALAVIVPFVLQGCCDKDAGLNCQVLNGCSKFTSCVKDAGCCKYEEDGSSMETTIASLCHSTTATSWGGYNACEGVDDAPDETNVIVIIAIIVFVLIIIPLCLCLLRDMHRRRKEYYRG